MAFPIAAQDRLRSRSSPIQSPMNLFTSSALAAISGKVLSISVSDIVCQGGVDTAATASAELECS